MIRHGAAVESRGGFLVILYTQKGRLNDRQFEESSSVLVGIGSGGNGSGGGEGDSSAGTEEKRRRGENAGRDGGAGNRLFESEGASGGWVVQQAGGDWRDGIDRDGNAAAGPFAGRSDGCQGPEIYHGQRAADGRNPFAQWPPDDV